MRPDFHVLIVGGGIVGACTAALLATQPALARLRIALLESRPPADPPADEEIDLRVSALSLASERILDSVGAWRTISPVHVSAYTDMRVWDSQARPRGAGSLHFSASATSEPNLGHIVENRRIQWALYDCPVFRDRVTLLRAELTALDFGRDEVSAVLNDGRRICAALVIGADGARSVSRRLAGLDASGWEYNQHAFVTHVRTALPHQRTAWQRFLADGPLAFLPLADGRSSIVWSTRPEHAQRLLSSSEAEVGVELEAGLDGVLGAVELAGPRGAFPLRLTHARSYCKERFVLVGDAAHAVHPLAGQGVNLGLLDAAALTEVLAREIEQSGRIEAIAELRALRQYERWRKSENLLAIGVIDGLNRLFGARSGLVGWARRAGLTAVDRNSVAKRLLIERAMGTRGEIPRVAADRRRP